MVFLLVFTVPLLMIGSVWLASVSDYPDIIIGLPLFVGFVMLPIVQALWKCTPFHVSEQTSARPFWQRYYRWLPLLTVPIHFVMLVVVLAGFIHIPFNIWGQSTLILASGIFSAIFAINIAHELIHRQKRFDRFCGGVLLSTVAFGTFKIVHLAIHHRYVGTARDFATARLHQNIFSFWLQSFSGNFREALLCEAKHLTRSKKPLWRSELVLWYGLSTLWLIFAIYWGSWASALFFVLQALIAIMYLDIINYLQHYGLQRKIKPDGRPEAMQEHHSWTQGMFLDDLVLLNLPRHSLHHTKPNLPFQLLHDSQSAPRYPFNYGLMTMIALIPPLFYRIADRSLAEFNASRKDAVIRDHTL